MDAATLLLADLVDDGANSTGFERLVRDLLVHHGGREIDKADGFLLLFDDATGALRFAESLHGGLSELDRPLRARVGLHVGPLVSRENTPEEVKHGAKRVEVEGIAKPIAARVMSVASPQQTLLTQSAADRAGPGFELQSVGFWQLKGVEEPLELFEALHAHAPA